MTLFLHSLTTVFISPSFKPTDKLDATSTQLSPMDTHSIVTLNQRASILLTKTYQYHVGDT